MPAASDRVSLPLRVPQGIFLVLGLAVGLLACPALAKGRKTGAPARPVIGVQANKMLKVSQTHLNKARSLREKGKNDLAIAEFRKALEIDPTLVEAGLELGDLYLELGIYPQSAEVLAATIPLAELQEFDPQVIGRAYCQLARAHRETGAFDPAAAALLKASELLPEDPEPLKILGDLQASRDRPEDAFQAYRQAGKGDPQNGDVWWAMGELALAKKRAREAAEALAGLAQADSLRAGAFRKMMTEAGLDAPAPDAIPAAPAADPYEGQDATAGSSAPPKPAPAAPKTAPEDVSSDDPYEDHDATTGSPAAPKTAPEKGSTGSRKIAPPNPAGLKPVPRPYPAGKTRPGKPAPVPDEDDPYAGEILPTPGAPGQSEATGTPAPAAVPATPSPAAADDPYGAAGEPSPAPQPATASTAGPRADPAPAPKPIPPQVIDDAVARFLGDDEEAAVKGRQDVLAIGAPAVPVLAGKLADPDPNLRRKTLQLLGEFGATAQPAFSSVEEALADPDPGVVDAAQSALDKIGAE